jgi:hypothetical protein
MAAKTNFLENKLIDWFYRGVAYTPPATLYIGLFTAAPSDTGGGTEVSGGSYARVGVAASTTNWAATNAAGSTAATSSGTSGTTSNNVVIAPPTATADWGTVTHFGIFDASTAGNLLIYGALTASQSIPNGGAYSFAAGALSIQEDN